MELMGLLIGVRALNFVRQNLRLELKDEFCWSDSQIVLSWLQSQEPKPIFVINRVREIRSYDSVKFGYVRSNSNPADLATRPIPPDELKKCSLWWEGPPWLKSPQLEWPDEFPVTLPRDELEEPSVTAAAIMELPEWISQSSNWARARRVGARVLRFFCNASKGKFFPDMTREGPITEADTNFVQKQFVRLSQRGLEQPFPPMTYLDVDKIRRLRTRLADAGEVSRSPALLSNRSGVCRLLIRHAHMLTHHSGVDATLNMFLRQFWCPRARRAVRTIIKGCNICKRDRAQKFKLPPFPTLPISRTMPANPFSHTGLDYLGPTLYKAPGGPQKAWILLLTCLTCRAVHLEMVDNLSADDFLMALRRLIARRGIPQTLLSDNAPQFILTKRTLEENSQLNIKWRMIPSYSPWSGGVYERLNALIKTCFRRALGRKMLTWTELYTFLNEVECTLNNRPITYVSDELDAPLALRPIDLINPKVQTILDPPTLRDDLAYNPSSRDKLAQRWWDTTRAVEDFWARWSREYIILLRDRRQFEHKNPRSTSELKPEIGQTVLIEIEDFPRNFWPMGRITQLEGPKDHARSAKIRMANGNIWSRPVNKLIPLEAAPEAGEGEQEPPAQAEPQGEIPPAQECPPTEMDVPALKARRSSRPPKPKPIFDPSPQNILSILLICSMVSIISGLMRVCPCATLRVLWSPPQLKPQAWKYAVRGYARPDRTIPHFYSHYHPIIW